MKIIHILRAPIGGLFRHVADLVRYQSDQGYDVGIISAHKVDSDYAQKLYASIGDKLALGYHELDIKRLPHLSDISNLSKIAQIIKEKDATHIHAHGAKGGLYGRLVSKRMNKDGHKIKNYYTFHGGSLHYSKSSPVGFVFLNIEKYLQKYTDGFVFESDHSKKLFQEKIDVLKVPAQTVVNGISESEISPRNLNDDATDFFYIGELRMLKGVDLLINALAEISRKTPHKPTLNIIGYGPDADYFKDMVAKKGLLQQVKFHPAMPARDAFNMGKVMIMPSRAEGLPYIILEAVAASVPIISSNVGGIPEIFQKQNEFLFDRDDQEKLTELMRQSLDDPNSIAAKTDILIEQVRDDFIDEIMAQKIVDFYQTD